MKTAEAILSVYAPPSGGQHTTSLSSWAAGIPAPSVLPSPASV